MASNFAGTHAGHRLWRDRSGSATSASHSIPPAMYWARRRSRSPARIPASSPPATTRTRPTRPARRSRWCPAMSSSPRRRSACRCSAMAEPPTRSKKLLASVALFPERAHLVGAYSLGKAQRVIALLRAAGYDAPIYLHGAMEKITRYYQSRGVALGELRMVKGDEEGRPRRHHHAGAAVGHVGHLDPAVSRSGHGVCVGLDAGARPRAAARRRIAAGDFRPCRLGRTDRDHRRHRRRRNLGDPWPGRRAGALVHGQGPRRAAARSGRLWRRR